MVKIFITIDVETSIGGAFAKPDKLRPVGADKRIYGQIGKREFGIPLIIDILNKHNLKATFFVEPFCSFYFGEKIIKEICHYILNRGHDVQLHLHPNYQIFKCPDWQERAKRKELFPDIIAKYTLDEQINLIKQGKKILEKYGIKPIAFRAGCFGANLNTLMALKENDFLIDSSYNLSFLGKTCFIHSLHLTSHLSRFTSHPSLLTSHISPLTSHVSPLTYLNDLTLINGIYELPITNCYDFKIGNFKRLRTLDICAVSFYEMKKILRYALKKGPKHITFILHSFSLIKKRDVQYKTARPNFIVINRFKKLCEFLSRNKNLFKVITLSQFAQSLPDYALRTTHYALQTKHYGLSTKHYELSTKDYGLWTKHYIPFTGNIPSLLRYVTQAIQYL